MGFYLLSGIVLFGYVGVKAIKEEPAEYTIGIETRRAFDIDKDQATVVSNSPEVSDASLVTTKVGVKFLTTSVLIKSVMTSVTIFTYLYLLAIIFNMRGFVHSLDNQNPFTEKNINRIRTVGLLLTFITPLKGLSGFCIDQLVDKNFTHTVFALGSTVGEVGYHLGYKIGYWIGYRFGSGEIISPWMIVGVIVLLISEVFRQGLKMKEEQDLTI
jgi:hypothetical protein